MNTRIVPVLTPQQFTELAELASTIWHEYFPVILSSEQIDYMVDRFQSEAAFEQQLKSGYRYFFFDVDGRHVGYTGIVPEEGHLFLSKLYLLGECRKKGYASRMLAFLVDLCRKEGLTFIRLTVNKHNEDPIAVYQAKGFKVVDECVTDIGGGFVMDDYIMELPVRS